MKKVTSKFAALFSASTLGLAPLATATTVSVDFRGPSSVPGIPPLTNAGVIPAPYWEPAFTNSGVVTPLTGGGLPSGVTVNYNAPGVWTVPSYVGGSTPGVGDDAMMNLALASVLTGPPFAATPITIDVNIASLASLGWTSYDVYVYSTGNNGGSGANSDISYDAVSGPQTINLDESGPAFGTVPDSVYLDGSGASPGNYVRFSGKTDTNFRIRSTPLTSSPNNDLSVINGIQIVGKIPEPSTALLGILGGCSVLLRRNRTKA